MRTIRTLHTHFSFSFVRLNSHLSFIPRRMPVRRGLLGVSVVVVVGVVFLMPTCCPTLPTNADTHNIVNIARITLAHIRGRQGPVWDGDHHRDSRFSAVFF